MGWHEWFFNNLLYCAESMMTIKIRISKLDFIKQKILEIIQHKYCFTIISLSLVERGPAWFTPDTSMSYNVTYIRIRHRLKIAPNRLTIQREAPRAGASVQVTGYLTDFWSCISRIGLYTVAKNRSTRKASWEDTYTSYEAYTWV